MSKYTQLAATIRADIDNGVYSAGDRLPTIPALCERYAVSNTTVKKAMDELEQQGLVARRRGSGVYVKSTNTLRRSLEGGVSTSGQMQGLSAEYAGTGQKVTSEVHEFSIVHPPQEVAEALDMRTEEFAYKICRVRLTNGVPRNVEYTYMPILVVPGLLEENLYGSIYGYITHELGLKIGSAHRVLKAAMPSEDECAWLRLQANEPVFEVKQVGYLDDGTPFEYSTTHHTCDYEFFVVSTY